jgi:ABC-type transport system involved in multi-copper enzyme maturation permease subunit
MITNYTPQEAFEISFIKGILQSGVLIVALISMDAIAGEREHNTLDLLPVRPVSWIQIIFSKFASQAIVILGAALASVIPVWAYVVYLYGELFLSAAILSALITALVLVFVSAATITCSILAKTQLVAGVGGIVTSAVLASLTVLPRPWNEVTPFHYSGIVSQTLQGTIMAATFLRNCLIVLGFIAIVFLFDGVFLGKTHARQT